MATWAQILAADPDAAQDFIEVVDQVLRPASGQFAQLLATLEAVKLVYDDTGSAFRVVLNNLDADAEIPNSGSGLAGAEALTKTLLLAELAPFGEMLTNYATNAAKLRRIKFAGINAQ